MNETMLLTILGSFISLLLIVNAYFTRETLLRVVKIEVQLRENQIKHEYVEKQSDEDHREIQRLRDRLHSLEGSQAQIIQFIDEYKE